MPAIQPLLSCTGAASGYAAGRRGALPCRRMLHAACFVTVFWLPGPTVFGSLGKSPGERRFFKANFSPAQAPPPAMLLVEGERYQVAERARAPNFAAVALSDKSQVTFIRYMNSLPPGDA